VPLQYPKSYLQWSYSVEMALHAFDLSKLKNLTASRFIGLKQSQTDVPVPRANPFESVLFQASLKSFVIMASFSVRPS
jgi:hypothetical protein